MAPVLEGDPAFDREAGENSPEDDTAKAPANAAAAALVEDSPSSDEQGTVVSEEEQTSEQQQEDDAVADNVGGGKEIDESVAESIAQPQPENAGPDAGPEAEDSEEVQGPGLTSDRLSFLTSIFDRASSLVASAHSNKEEEKQETDEVVQSVMHAATPWVQAAVEQLHGLRKGVAETTDHAFRAACNQLGDLQDSTTTNYYYAQDSYWRWRRAFNEVESSFFDSLKNGLKEVADRPGLATTLGIGAALVLFRRPRRLLFRHTIGRFRSEEAMLATAQRKVQDLRESLHHQLQDKSKLQERYNLAEAEFLSGRSKLENTGGQIRSLVRHLYKTEGQAQGLLERLRELPGKEALQLRAEVASMGAQVKKERATLDKKLYKIADYNIPA